MRFLRVLSVLKLSACVSEGREFKYCMSWFCTFFPVHPLQSSPRLFRCSSCIFIQKETGEVLFPSPFTETFTSSFFLSFFFFLLGKGVRVSEKPTRSYPNLRSGEPYLDIFNPTVPCNNLVLTMIVFFIFKMQFLKVSKLFLASVF